MARPSRLLKCTGILQIALLTNRQTSSLPFPIKRIVFWKPLFPYGILHPHNVG